MGLVVARNRSCTRSQAAEASLASGVPKSYAAEKTRALRRCRGRSIWAQSVGFIVHAPKAGQCLERCTFTQQNRICLFLMNTARTTSTYVATHMNNIVVQVAVEECGTIPRSPRAGSEDSCSKIFGRKRGRRHVNCDSGGHTVHTVAATERLLPLPSSSSRPSSFPEKVSTCWLAVPQWPTAPERQMSAHLRHPQTHLRCP